MFKSIKEWLGEKIRLYLNYAFPFDPKAEALIDGIIHNNVNSQEVGKATTIQLKQEDLPVYARGRVLPPKAKQKFAKAAKASTK